MDRWKSWKSAEGSLLSAWYQRVRESYVAVWFFGVFQNSGTMSTSAIPGGGGGGGGVGGALSLMGCVREASPPPQNHHQHHHQQPRHHRAFGLADFPMAQHSVDPLPKGRYSSGYSSRCTEDARGDAADEKVGVIKLTRSRRHLLRYCDVTVSFLSFFLSIMFAIKIRSSRVFTISLLCSGIIPAFAKATIIRVNIL